MLLSPRAHATASRSAKASESSGEKYLADYHEKEHPPQAEQQKEELEKRDKEMYSLKHDLIESQMTLENQEKTSAEEAQALQEQLERKQEEIQELKTQIARLEAEAKARNKNNGNRSYNGAGNNRSSQGGSGQAGSQ